tara:strand:- start:947 stop:1060 length:114 start_codon:yes stop_codon:yes gene_type:complete
MLDPKPRIVEENDKKNIELIKNIITQITFMMKIDKWK